MFVPPPISAQGTAFADAHRIFSRRSDEGVAPRDASWKLDGQWHDRRLFHIEVLWCLGLWHWPLHDDAASVFASRLMSWPLARAMAITICLPPQIPPRGCSFLAVGELRRTRSLPLRGLPNNSVGGLPRSINAVQILASFNQHGPETRKEPKVALGLEMAMYGAVLPERLRKPVPLAP